MILGGPTMSADPISRLEVVQREIDQCLQQKVTPPLARTGTRMPAGAGGLGRARPFGEHSNDRHQEAKERDLFHVPPTGRWCVLGASA
jgi:hypothetical protein